jgi:hypothetical protein
VELISDLTPEEHKRLIFSIRKQKERSTRKKNAKDGGDGDEEDDELQQQIREHKQAHEMRKNSAAATGKNQQKPKFDEIMNDSEGSEGSENEDDFLPAQLKEQLAGKLAARKNKQGTWIKEEMGNAMDEDEPLDFLDRNAISRVVCEFFSFSIMK